MRKVVYIYKKDGSYRIGIYIGFDLFEAENYYRLPETVKKNARTFARLMNLKIEGEFAEELNSELEAEKQPPEIRSELTHEQEVSLVHPPPDPSIILEIQNNLDSLGEESR